MAKTIKVINGFYTECDDYDNPIRTYHNLSVERVKQIAFSGDRIVAILHGGSIEEYVDGMYSGGYWPPGLPENIQNIRLSGNTVVLETTNGAGGDVIYECDFGTNGSSWRQRQM